MLVKNFLVTTWLVLMAAAVGAQVYSLTPVYLVQSLELSKTNLALLSVDSFSRGGFIVDLDKMVFTDPATIMSKPRVSTIKKVTRLSGNLLMFKIKKDNKYSSDLFYLKLNESGKPLSIQDGNRTYTSNPASLNLYSVCTKIKMATVPYTEGANAPDRLMKPALATAVLTDAYNIFELKNGAITWTEGKGKKALLHQITISESTVSTKPEIYYLQFAGSDAEGTKYNVIFYRINSQYPHYNHIEFEKVTKNNWTTMFLY